MLKITPDISEMCGIHAGDGYLRNDGKRAEVDISGNVEEKDYYDYHVIPLFNRVFKIKTTGRYFSHRNTYGFVLRDKKIIEFFSKLGFPYGKKAHVVSIPKLILATKNEKNYSAFLRGLFDTDGSFSFIKRNKGKYSKFKKEFHYYPRIILTTTSLNLHKDSCNILRKLGFFPISEYTYIPKKLSEHKKHIILLYGGEKLEKWMKLIGSKNQSKYYKYLIWKRYGFCPPNLSIHHKREILNNRKNPLSFYGSVR